ncbi:MAG: damage-control phosphatase ARMT1 family protein [Anaerolineae bacterium]|nr:damage-control phosphatase ARMT1 family protein [Thermoflexales bacterium]MDW8407155.1 damage-control phosphatase ARMT1 family protein [Anaerolineae bacterium]
MAAKTIQKGLSVILPSLSDIPESAVDLSRWPASLHTSEPNSFAHNTFKRRIPAIIDEIIADNAFAPDILASMQVLRDEIIAGSIQALGAAEPDAPFWNAVSAPHIGQSWLNVPWYWAEAYFYRRVLECTRYFQPAHPWHGVDPYANKKLAELRPERAPAALDSLLSGLPNDQNKCFRHLCYASLWGNRSDLSYNVARTVRPAANLDDERIHLLIDDSEAVWEYLAARSSRAGSSPTLRLAVITDNAGAELLADLALVGFLLQRGIAGQVHLHLKGQPFFVSDATPRDVLDSLTALSQSGPAAHRLAAALRTDIGRGVLQLRTHWFYSSCLMYYQMPDALRRELAGYDLVILKGDANYRRLLGDARWEPTTSFHRIVSYFPAPLFALRTLKAELIAGLKLGQAEQLFQLDPDWRVNGRRGVAQASLP